jgi:hypothetical protein
MNTVETVMAEQLDAIIRRLNTRIDSYADAKRQKTRPSIGKLKKNLGRIKSIRARFETTAQEPTVGA